MGDQYIPGDFWRICDKTGYKVRSSQTRHEWTGAIVRRESWDARHPQDFVRSRRDRQSVKDARPRSADVFQGPAVATLTADAIAGAYVIAVSSVTDILDDDIITVILDNGDTHRVQVLEISGLNLTLLTPLPLSASVGNVVTIEAP